MLKHRACGLAMCIAGAILGTGASVGAKEAPDWRDQIIYFAMIDRFDNGDRSNDDQGAGEFDPADPRRFSGGDLAGVERRLDYIRGLGATALWITPPVANQWWSERANYSGYHGYWARDFTRVDPHFGDMESYRKVAEGLHSRGMLLVQDVVVNHTGDFFSCEREDDCQRHDNSPLFPLLLQANDPQNPADRARGVYHWTPDIKDFSDRRQELTYQLSSLDDLNTESPEVRRALRKVYADWIDNVGVDAFRVDTAFYAPETYFRDFLYSDDPAAPGISRLHPLVGGVGFHVFGEGFGMDRAFEETQARRIDAYTRDESGPLLPGMINFPLYGSLLDVFARGRPTAELGWRIESTMRVNSNPWLMPNFVDNHDVSRFLAGGSEQGLRQALLAMMTLPGIPVIYYGTEQGFRGQRDSMFAGGYGSGGQDHFNPAHPLYQYLKRASALRRDNRVLSRGTPTVLRAEGGAPGALAWRMDDDEGQRALVVFNNASHAVLLDGLETGLPAGSVLQPLFAIDGDAPSVQVGQAGRMDLVLPAYSGMVWRVGTAKAMAAVEGTVPVMDMLPRGALHGELEVKGRAVPLSTVEVVVDGDLSRSQKALVDNDGRWIARLRSDAWVDPATAHRVVAWARPAMAISNPQQFTVQRDWRSAGRIEDPAGDDHGPSGSYRYPNDPGWTQARPADLRKVEAFASGGSLKLQVELASLGSMWNAPNGFDHVALTVYIGLPGRAGLRQMPLQNAQLPDGLHWNYRLRIGGWSNALTTTLQAGADNEGEAATPGAQLAVDTTNKRITITLPASALGDPVDLTAATVVVTTWDYDGAYRGLVPEGGAMQFGGGDGREDPLWLDMATLHLH
ncbi:alpha-amylase family glycosyl hydrolase [Stenotrophomonas sp.]|uniref:alpha-amylase family glycosyl hydrolase n=1 Tax=Stenotrophomonas sp. TaxID=69392 RepID=UPI0028AB0ED4|nr:alpha-amylase family glycosyl hydrolase [Stenotrophomonas sp.]